MKHVYRYFVLVGGLEVLGRLYLAFLRGNAGDGVIRVLEQLIREYLLLLGDVADRIRANEHVDLELPGDPIHITIHAKQLMKQAGENTS